MQTTIQLPQAFSVRDEHEFLAFEHLVARLNPNLVVRQVATGIHVNGGGTVYWGLVSQEGEPLLRTEVEAALRLAGFDFAHNVLTQIVKVWAKD